MLKQQSSLRWQLVAWIFGGFLLLVLAPLWAKHSLCPPKEPNVWTIQGKKNTQQNDGPSNGMNDLFVLEQKQTKSEKNTLSFHDLGGFARAAVCEKSKPTDLLLAFFTYCLCFVGWFTIRSGERNAKDLERAYIFATPQIDTKQTANDGSVFVEVMLQNYGRTMGTVKTIYGEVSPNVEPFGRPMYKNGSARHAGGALGPTRGIPVRAPVTFECPLRQDFYFFGYVEYDDLFMRPHTSRFCAKIFLDKRGIEAAGPEAFHDWN